MKICSLINRPVKCGSNAVHELLLCQEENISWELIALRQADDIECIPHTDTLNFSFWKLFSPNFWRKAVDVLNEFEVVLVDGIVNFYLVAFLVRLINLKANFYFLVHNEYYPVSNRTSNRLVPSLVFALLYDLVLKSNANNITVSASTQKFLKKRGINSAVVATGAFITSTISPMATELCHIWYVGRLLDIKRIDLLIHALAKIDMPYLLNIVGSGPELKNLESLSNKLRVNAKFLGFKQNPFLEVRKADLFVLPSIIEGRSIALMEALMKGTFVLASDIEANKQFKDYGVQYFESGNVESLLNRLSSTISLGLQVRLGHIDFHRTKIITQLSNHRMRENYIKIFHDQ